MPRDALASRLAKAARNRVETSHEVGAPFQNSGKPYGKRQQDVGGQHVADATGMVGLPGRSEMTQRCELCRDRAKATSLASLGRLARETTSLDHNGLGDGLAPLTPASSHALAAGPDPELHGQVTSEAARILDQLDRDATSGGTGALGQRHRGVRVAAQPGVRRCVAIAATTIRACAGHTSPPRSG
jgi:hypothetical protein